MAEIVVSTDDVATVEQALGTGYVIRYDDEAGTAVIDAPDLADKALAKVADEAKVAFEPVEGT